MESDIVFEERLRVYCDTSVLGGCFDEEFRQASNRLMDRFRSGDFVLVFSEITLLEIESAPMCVRDILEGIPRIHQEKVKPCLEIDQLRDAYLDAKVLGPSSMTDAWHIASASVAGVDMVVSWNFKHIVHFDKIAGFHAVNKRLGYRTVSIYSPLEVV